ncbi:MAG TPA: cyclic pyranopterin monophosphate synthase MoaC [Iamia sp.]|jgi:cyclic pyranopterin phosphate synthase|nr:cyclic pyranopterin monophosphate synthase MoaC [Iamia sp.]
MPDRGLTHLDPLGRARMVDVTPKDPTHRRAVARGRVYMHPETTSLVARGGVGKGDVLAVARVAAIQAAKRASDLIPLCHPLLVGAVLVNFRIEDTFIEVEAHVDTVDRTGVEMEALTACAVAALTIYDMCKSADRSMTIGDIALWEKTGGRSGVYRREPEPGLDQSIDSVLLDHARSTVGDGVTDGEPGDGSPGMIGPAGLGDPAEV